jgi:hypothetical protein
VTTTIQNVDSTGDVATAQSIETTRDVTITTQASDAMEDVTTTPERVDSTVDMTSSTRIIWSC